MPGVTFGLRLLVNHAERGRDAGCAVSTLPGNVRLTSDPVREAAVQVAFSETLTPALRLIRCNLKRKSGARGAKDFRFTCYGAAATHRHRLFHPVPVRICI